MDDKLIMELDFKDSASPGVKKFKNSLQTLLDKLQKGNDLIKKFSDSNSKMAKVVDASFSSIKKSISVLKGLTNTLLSVTKTITGKVINGFKKLISSVFSLKGMILSTIGIYGLKGLISSFIDAASTAEQYRVQLEISTRSTSKAAQIFKAMSDYASKVPHTYEDIMASATQLSRVMGGSVQKVKEWIPFIGDLAAGIGLGIQDTTTQVVKMLSRGAAAADRFGELGVLSMMGFKAGVSYSVEETRKIMLDSWTKADSQFRGATDKLADTWEGLMSMMSDKWFQFRNKVMESGLFDLMKESLRDFLDWSGGILEGKNFETMLKNITNKIVTTVVSILRGMGTFFDAIVIIFNSIKESLKTIMDLIYKIPGVKAPEEKELETLVRTLKILNKGRKETNEEIKQLENTMKTVKSFIEEETGVLGKTWEVIKWFKPGLKAKTEAEVEATPDPFKSKEEAEKQLKNLQLQLEPLISRRSDFDKNIERITISIKSYDKSINKNKETLDKSSNIVNNFGKMFDKVADGLEKNWKNIQKNIKVTKQQEEEPFEAGFVEEAKRLEEEYIKETKKYLKELHNAWINTVKSLVSVLENNLHDFLTGTEVTFEQFSKDFRSIFTKKFIKDMEKDLKGLGSKITAGLTMEEKEKWGKIGNTIGNAISGATAGYQIGGMMGGAEEGATFGAIGGAIGSIWGPAGSAAGGVLGGMLGNMIGETEKSWKESVPPDINVLFEVVNGKLEEAGEWGKKAGVEVRDRVRALVKEQINVMKTIFGIFGEEFENVSIGFQGYADRIGAGIESGLQKSFVILSSLPETMNLLSEEAIESIREEVTERVFGAGYKGIAGVEGAVRVATGHGLEMTQVGYGVVDEILSGSEEGAKLWTTVIDDWMAGHSEKGWNIMMGDMDVFWGNVYDEFVKIVEKMNKHFSQSVEDAFTTALESDDFSKTFANNLRANIYKSVKDGLIKAFKEKLYLKLLNPLWDNLAGVFDQIEDLSNMTTTEAQNKMNEIVYGFSDTMDGFMADIETINPMLEIFYNQIQKLDESFEGVTQAMSENQTALVDELLARKKLIDDFVREMRGGELAPARSVEWFQTEYQKLLTAAQGGGTEELNTLLNFVKGDYMTFMKATSSTEQAYNDTFEMVMSQIEEMSPPKEIMTQELTTLIDILAELGNQTELMQTYTNILTGYGTNLDEPITAEVPQTLTYESSNTLLTGSPGPIRRGRTTGETSTSGNINITLEVDGREIGRAFIDQTETNPDVGKAIRRVI